MPASLDYTISLAQQTGDLLKSYFERASLDTRLKVDHSVVTEADIAADELISASLKQAYPDDLLLSEELSPSASGKDDAPHPGLWIIDPLDGTTNFSLGLHYWGVLITYLEAGYPVLAVMFFPLLNELYTVQSGHGAALNGQPIQVEPPDPQKRTTFFSCCSRTHKRYQVSVAYKSRILGSAAYSLCAIARGIALVSFEATPKIWDIAGGWLLVQEAGGSVETLDGSQPFPVRLDQSYARLNFPTLAAATPGLLLQSHDQIVPKQS
jgi:myo-inositol-1(or 4)-monophosphatase